MGKINSKQYPNLNESQELVEKSKEQIQELQEKICSLNKKLKNYKQMIV